MFWRLECHKNYGDVIGAIKIRMDRFLQQARCNVGIGLRALV